MTRFFTEKVTSLDWSDNFFFVVAFSVIATACARVAGLLRLKGSFFDSCQKLGSFKACARLAETLGLKDFFFLQVQECKIHS